MPKFPPPPRTAQNRSAFSSALATTKLPSASTMSTESRLSMVSPYLRVRWPIPPPKRQPGDAGARDDARRHGQAEGVGRMVHIAPLAARAHQHGARGRIHPHVVDGRQIDDQAVIADAQSGRIVPAAADRNPQVIGLRHPHGGDHIGDVGTFGDQPRLAIDHGVVDFPRLVVTGIFGFEHGAAELAAKFGNRLL